MHKNKSIYDIEKSLNRDLEKKEYVVSAKIVRCNEPELKKVLKMLPFAEIKKKARNVRYRGKIDFYSYLAVRENFYLTKKYLKSLGVVKQLKVFVFSKRLTEKLYKEE